MNFKIIGILKLNHCFPLIFRFSKTNQLIDFFSLMTNCQAYVNLKIAFTSKMPLFRARISIKHDFQNKTAKKLNSVIVG